MHCRFEAIPDEMQPVKGVEKKVAIGLDNQVFMRLNKILHTGGRQTASWVQELAVDVFEDLLMETAPAAPSICGSGELPATQSRPPSLRIAPKPSHKKAGSPEAPTGTSSGNRLRADFVLRHRPESSALGSSMAVTIDSTEGASADGLSVASTSSMGHPDVNLMAVVSEVKRLGKLVNADGNPLDLHKLFMEGHKSVRRMLNQLYTYMVLTGVEFGFLSCFYFTWIAWRPLSSPDCLHLSGPFRHDTSAASGGVTTMAALSWIQDLAMERTIGQAIRHAPYVRPAATGGIRSPETSDVEDDGADDDDEDWKDSGGGDQDSGDGGGGGGGNEARDVPSAASMGGDRGSKRYVNGDSAFVPCYRCGSMCLKLLIGSHTPSIHSAHAADHVFPPFHVHRKGPETPSCSGREVPEFVDIPLLPVEALGPLKRDKALRKGGSSCCVLRAVYLGQEVAVKLIYNSRDGYADACHEACMYQVG